MSVDEIPLVVERLVWLRFGVICRPLRLGRRVDRRRHGVREDRLSSAVRAIERGTLSRRALGRANSIPQCQGAGILRTKRQGLTETARGRRDVAAIAEIAGGRQV